MTSNMPPEIRLSYSTMKTLYSCPRKFELARVRNPLLNDFSDEGNLNTMVGNTAHRGLQSYWLHGSRERAIVDAWIEYEPYLEEDKSAKHWGTVYEGLEELIERVDASGWELVGERVEYSYKILLNDEGTHYYCGRMDGVLTKDGRIAQAEIKTTGSKTRHVEALFANSNQGLGNSVVLDSVAPDHSSFVMVFPVMQFKSPRIVDTYIFEFEKTRADRLEWLQSLILDYQRILAMLEYNLFPRNGDSCLGYGSPCPFFGGCDTVGDEWSPVKEDEEEWEIEFHINDLIERQLR